MNRRQSGDTGGPQADPTGALSQGVQVGEPDTGNSLVVPLSITQCGHFVVYYNVARDSVVEFTKEGHSDVFFTLRTPMGEGYMDWVCDIPAGHRFTAWGSGGGYTYTVDDGSSDCLDVLTMTTAFTYASYSLPYFTSYTAEEILPIPTDLPAQTSLSTVDFPTNWNLPTISVPTGVFGAQTTSVHHVADHHLTVHHVVIAAYIVGAIVVLLLPICCYRRFFQSLFTSIFKGSSSELPFSRPDGVPDTAEVRRTRYPITRPMPPDPPPPLVRPVSGPQNVRPTTPPVAARAQAPLPPPAHTPSHSRSTSLPVPPLPASVEPSFIRPDLFAPVVKRDPPPSGNTVPQVPATEPRTAASAAGPMESTSDSIPNPVILVPPPAQARPSYIKMPVSDKPLPMQLGRSEPIVIPLSQHSHSTTPSGAGGGSDQSQPGWVLYPDTGVTREPTEAELSRLWQSHPDPTPEGSTLPLPRLSDRIAKVFPPPAPTVPKHERTNSAPAPSAPSPASVVGGTSSNPAVSKDRLTKRASVDVPPTRSRWMDRIVADDSDPPVTRGATGHKRSRSRYANSDELAAIGILGSKTVFQRKVFLDSVEGLGKARESSMEEEEENRLRINLHNPTPAQRAALQVLNARGRDRRQALVASLLAERSGDNGNTPTTTATTTTAAAYTTTSSALPKRPAVAVSEPIDVPLPPVAQVIKGGRGKKRRGEVLSRPRVVDTPAAPGSSLRGAGALGQASSSSASVSARFSPRIHDPRERRGGEVVSESELATAVDILAALGPSQRSTFLAGALRHSSSSSSSSSSASISTSPSTQDSPRIDRQWLSLSAGAEDKAAVVDIMNSLSDEEKRWLVSTVLESLKGDNVDDDATTQGYEF